MSAAREEVLARIRTALRDRPAPPDVARDYRVSGEVAAGGPALLDLLAERLADYRAQVVRAQEAGLRDAVRRVLQERGVTDEAAVLLPPGLPDEWAPAGTRDHAGLGPRELDAVAAVVTGCRAACAETGTIALDHAPDQGRRAITLVPDVHVCVVHADQVVATVPELLARLDPTRPITFVSGPSATSDIELDRVEGVHGPRTLVVVLAAP